VVQTISSTVTAHLQNENDKLLHDEIVCSLHTKSQFYVKALPLPDITMAVESNITTPQCISHQHNKF
jgi:hypothetical protein